MTGGTVASERIPVEPRVLVWARESLHLAPDQAASKLGVSLNVLTEWEDGDREPTISQLRRAAKVYKRPLAVLLLPDPPLDFSVPRDFREGPTEPSPKLAEEIRRAHEQRLVMEEISNLRLDLAPEPSEVPSLSRRDDPEVSGQRLREFVGVSVEEQQSWASARDALNEWIAAVEARGVLIIQTDRVDTSETRGFSIHADRYPVIAVNGSDWPRPKVFTIFHELAHLGLGRGGICDLHDRPPGSEDVEALCNRIAAAALLPAEAVRQTVDDLRLPRPNGWSLDALGAVARRFRVSQETALLRLVTLNRAAWDDYTRLKPELEERYREAFEARRERMRESPGGPSYYVMRARNLGRTYTSTVLDAYRADAISSLDVATYLGIRFKQLPNLESVA